MKEAKEITWGYSPVLFEESEGQTQTGKFKLLSKLIFIDKSTGNKLENSDEFFTMTESDEEYQRVNRISPVDRNLIEIMQHYQIGLIFTNTGGTEIKDQSCIVTITDDDGNIIYDVRTHPVSSLGPAQTANIYPELYIPIDSSLPKHLKIIISTEFKNINNEAIQRIITVQYESLSDYWTF